ncbi:MAG: hypothetical protein QM778_39270 [Myxococcales bacterium]
MAAAADHPRDEHEAGAADDDQQGREQRQRHRFAPLRVEQRLGIPAEQRVRMRPVEHARDEVVGMRGEPAVRGPHDQPRQRQHREQQADDEGELAGDRGDRVVGLAEQPARR